MNKRLLMISTDRLIFDKKSDVALRQIRYAQSYETVDILVFNTKKQGLADKFELSDNCKVYSTDSVSRLFYPIDAKKIGVTIIRERKINEITCQDSSLTAMVGVYLKDKFNIPLEIQIHGDIGSPYFKKNYLNKIRLFLSKRYLPRADRIRVVSNRIKDYVSSIFDQKCIDLKDRPVIEVRPIFVDGELIKSAPIIVDLHQKYKQFTKVALMASRLEKEKNIELAINSWAEVIKSFPGAGLLIVGNGSREKSLKHLVKSRRLENSVVFENWVDKGILYSYYKTADLFLNTSLFEGYGMTLVEANYAGCKIISTDVGVAREVGAIISSFESVRFAEDIIKSL